MVTIPTGIHCIDSKIGGGIQPESVNLIYGEPETGKSTLAMQCAKNCALLGYKVLFVDCDNTFYTQRLAQISKNQFDQVAEKIVLLKPLDFKQQTAVVDQIDDYVSGNVGLIIFDTFTSLYGAKVCETKGKNFSVNRELNRQLAILAQTARIRKIPIVITSQVRNVFNEQSTCVRPVATRVLKFWADTIIDLKPMEALQEIQAVVEKTVESMEETTCYVQIGEAGIQDTQFP